MRASRRKGKWRPKPVELIEWPDRIHYETHIALDPKAPLPATIKKGDRVISLGLLVGDRVNSMDRLVRINVIGPCFTYQLRTTLPDRLFDDDRRATVAQQLAEVIA